MDNQDNGLGNEGDPNANAKELEDELLKAGADTSPTKKKWDDSDDNATGSAK